MTEKFELTAAREAVLQRTAEVLLEARRTRQPMNDLPADRMPANETEAFSVQDAMAATLGEVGGYKVGARGADAEPFFAPMPAIGIATNGTEFRGFAAHRMHGVEAEIAFQMGQDLPPRDTPYTREEVTAAIATCHPAIEVLDSAYIDPGKVSRVAMMADMQMHGGFVAGPSVPQWQTIDWTKETVTLLIDGVVRAEGTGSNPGGTDLLRLITYVANEGARRTGGLRRGQWITTGSWTGVNYAGAGATVVARFGKAGEAAMEFASATETA